MKKHFISKQLSGNFQNEDSCFMRFAIDVVYIDKEYSIIKVVKNLKPWLGLSVCSRAWATLEMTAGEAERCGCATGKKLTLVS